MSDQLDPVLLAKWIAGQLGPDDERALAEWLAADPTRPAELEELRELWRMAGEVAQAQAAAADPAEAARWAGVRRGIHESEQAAAGGAAGPTSTRPTIVRTIELPFNRRRSRTWAWATAAAALALAVGGGILVSADRSRREIAVMPRPMRLYETSRGERAEFRLSDGTRVMLNVASRVRVPTDFGKRNRTVYLEGAAFFDVVHDANRPFVVRAGDVVAQDLGTEFVVRAYPEDRHARVIVRAGKVALRPAAGADTMSAATLSPGQSGTLSASGRPVAQNADIALEFAWTSGTLVLDGTPLRNALPELSRWFDLDFRLADTSLGGISVAATLTNQPTDEALGFLAASLGLRADRQGRMVTFRPAHPRR
jgi:transmembrane sensor